MTGLPALDRGLAVLLSLCLVLLLVWALWMTLKDEA